MPEMRSLTNSDLIALWERGCGMHPLDRALLVLNTAFPDSSVHVADWILGQRNQALLELQCSLFSSNLQAWAVCESCGEKMEFTLNAQDFLQQNGVAGAQATVEVNGQAFRLPTSRDLVAVSRQRDVESAAVKLLELCKANQSSTHWTVEELEQIGEKMALADPLAEIRLAVACPACESESVETVDVTSFLWAEIEGLAKRLLWEVHAIASAYGWTEAEVLALGPARRARYVEMAQA